MAKPERVTSVEWASDPIPDETIVPDAIDAVSTAQGLLTASPAVAAGTA